MNNPRADSGEPAADAQQFALLRQLERTLGTGAWSYAPASGACTWSDSVYTLLGDDRSTPPSLDRLLAHCEPSSRQQLAQAVQRALDSGIGWDLALTLARGGTAHRRVRCTGQRLAGGAVAIFATLQALPKYHADGRPDDFDEALRWAATEPMAAQPAAADAIAPLTPAPSVYSSQTGIGTWMRDLKTGERRWDETLKSIFGLPADAPTPSHQQYLELIVPEDRARIDMLQQQMAALGDYLEADYRIVTPGGERRHILSRISVLPDDHGLPRLVVGAAIDHTTSRRAFQELNDTHERLQLISETSGVGTWERDLQTGRGRWDEALFRIFGLPLATEAPSRAAMLALVHPDDRATVASAWQHMVDVDHTIEYEYRIVRPDGGILVVNTRGQAQRDADGAPRRALGVIIDITASRVAQRQLREADEWLRLAGAATGVGFFRAGLDDDTLYLDAQMLRLVGLDQQSAPPTMERLLDLLIPEDREPAVQARDRALTGTDTVEVLYRIAHPTLGLRVLQVRQAMQRDHRGTPAFLVGVALDVTDEQRAERERADLLARLQLVTSTAGIGVWERDLVTGAEFWDARMRAIHGVDETFTPTFDRWLNFVIPEQRSNAVVALQASLAGHGGTAEHQILRADGALRTVAHNAVVIRDAAGGPVRLLGTAVDVSDTRRAQLERDELYDCVQLVSETVALGIWDWDLLAERSVWNDQMYALFGRTREQFANMIWLDAVHPEDLAMARSSLELTLAKRPSFDIEFRVLWPDGSVHWIASRGRVQRDAVGNAVRMLGVNWDVTQRHEAEQQLRELVERFRMTTAATGIGLWTLDLDNGRVTWDEQMLRLYGRRADEIPDLARAWIEFTHPDERETVQAAAIRAARDGEPLEIDVRIVRPDGEVRTIAHRAQLQRDQSGRAVRQLGVCWDVTERARTEAALRDKETAERASRAKSEFLSRVSHELRTPLNAILGFAQILEIDRKAPLNPTQHEWVRQIMTAGRHLLALINDVLDLSRIEAGADTLNIRPTALAPVIEASMALVAGQASARGITVQGPTAATALPDVWVDATRLQQVLLNLLSNAVKYNRDGGRIEVAVSGAQAGMVAISVHDTGTGMNEQQVAQLFQPFNRLGRETQAIEGAGIGLAITQRLVEQMGGSLTVHSEAGIGSAFTVVLRAAAGAGAVPVPSSADADAAARTDIRGSVLYVEDNASNRALVEALLATRPNVELRIANDGQTGLQLAAARRPDVTLIDISLPDMNGLELLQRLRRLPQFGDVPCIAVSANALTHEIEQAIRAGFDDYWTKPLQATRFLRALDQLLAHRSDPSGA